MPMSSGAGARGDRKTDVGGPKRKRPRNKEDRFISFYNNQGTTSEDPRQTGQSFAVWIGNSL